MATKLRLGIGFTVDIKEFSTQMQTVSRKMVKFGNEMQAAGRSMTTYLSLPLALAGGASLKLASDVQESMNKVDVAFGQSAIIVKKFAETTMESFGLAQGTALDMAANFGDMGTAMGLSTLEAAKMSTSLVGLAGDLASFKNISIDIANTALTSIFTGETESLKRLGIVMTQHNLNQFAMQKGLGKTVQQMTQAEATMLRYEYILANTKNSQGDFARTQENAANQGRKFTEGLKQLGAQIGEIILPAFTQLLAFGNSLIKGFSGLSDETKKWIVVVGVAVAAIGPLLIAIGAISQLIPVLLVGFAKIKAAFLFITGPIGIAIAVVAGLVAAFIYLRKNWDVVAERISNGWAKVKNKMVDGLIVMVKAFTFLGEKVLNLFGFSIQDTVLPLLESLKTEVKENTKEFGTFGDAIKDAMGITKKLKIESSFNLPEDQPTAEPQVSSGGGQGGYQMPKGAIPTIDARGVNSQYDEIIAKQEEVKQSTMSIADPLPIVAGHFEDFSYRMNASMENLNQIFTNMVNDMATSFGEFIGDMVNGDMAVENFGVNILQSLAAFAGEFGKALIAIGIGKLGLDTLFSAGPAGGPLAIAAGIGLVALSKIAQNTAAKTSRALQSVGQNTSTPDLGGGSYGSSNFANRNDNQMVLETVVYGNDLYLSNQRTSNRMYRVK